DAPALLNHAIVNCIDVEKWERDRTGKKLTEIGLSTFAVSDMHAVKNNGPRGENLLKRMWFYHYRIIPYAHLINGRFCEGNPTKNHFGTTCFIDLDEAKRMLESAFKWPTKGGTAEPFSPVIFLGHALRGDIKMLRDAYNLPKSTFDMVVKTIDTQDMAPAVGLWHGKNKISLLNLCAYNDFDFADPHTAGNDAAYTMISAVFMV
ncbi:hypothetical protein M011DRAFT_376559, partial [Sporormia fimetaria CBS 119925]